MSKINELKSIPGNEINIIDYIKTLFPIDTKSKYIELFYRLLKKKCHDFSSKTENKDVNPFYFMFTLGIGTLIPMEEIKKFSFFIAYNEQGLIEKNDVTSYKSIDEVLTEYNKALMKIEEKELEKEIHKILDNDDWLILRPLSHKSSLKYGANTKWCTATKNDPGVFDKYTKDGILIYCIKKDGSSKVAFYESISESPTKLSCYDERDQVIDSLKSGIPFPVLSSIIDEITDNRVSNKSLIAKKKLESARETKNNTDLTYHLGSMIPSDMEIFEDASSGISYMWDASTNEIKELALKYHESILTR
jgi:hypothetical protein